MMTVYLVLASSAAAIWVAGFQLGRTWPKRKPSTHEFDDVTLDRLRRLLLHPSPDIQMSASIPYRTLDGSPVDTITRSTRSHMYAPFGSPCPRCGHEDHLVHREWVEIDAVVDGVYDPGYHERHCDECGAEWKEAEKGLG